MYLRVRTRTRVFRLRFGVVLRDLREPASRRMRWPPAGSDIPVPKKISRLLVGIDSGTVRALKTVAAETPAGSVSRHLLKGTK